MSPPLVALREVSLFHGGQPVLDRVTLAVRAGQIVTVVGPNGAGKSSLLKVALGLVRPSRGQVERDGAAVIGYMPQTLGLDRTLPLTAGRFLRMAVRERLTDAQVQDALDQVHAGHVRDRQMAVLSGGETQRVLLARALLRRPRLLVLDEPVGGVDMAGQAELYGLIGRQARFGGCGVLMVSHDLHVVMADTDEVVCLNRHVCCAGHPEAVSRHPEYLSLFGPKAASSLAVYTHHHDHVHDPDGSVHVHSKECDHG